MIQYRFPTTLDVASDKQSILRGATGPIAEWILPSRSVSTLKEVDHIELLSFRTH